MNSQQRLYDFEVTPPAEVWNLIAKELDAIEADKKWVNRINNLETPPPAGFWDKIAGKLNESNAFKTVSEKLAGFEVAPPAMAWEHIQDELDDQQALDIIAQKLKNLKAQPPAAAWNNISHALDQKPAKVIPLHDAKHGGWLKYAAAACVIAILSVTGFFIFNDSSTDSGGLANTGTPQNQAPHGNNPASGTDNNTIQQNVSTSVSQPAAREGGNAMVALRTKMGNAYTTTLEKNREMQDRYIVLMTQDGNIVRMSKKVGYMADGIAGADHSFDEQISKWQKEVATMPAASTPDNLLEILDLASDDAKTPTPKTDM